MAHIVRNELSWSVYQYLSIIFYLWLFFFFWKWTSHFKNVSPKIYYRKDWWKYYANRAYLCTPCNHMRIHESFLVPFCLCFPNGKEAFSFNPGSLTEEDMPFFIDIHWIEERICLQTLQLCFVSALKYKAYMTSLSKRLFGLVWFGFTAHQPL